jgi:hypothetical protein
VPLKHQHKEVQKVMLDQDLQMYTTACNSHGKNILLRKCQKGLGTAVE